MDRIRTFLFPAAIGVLALSCTACRPKTESSAVIGGADAPTGIFVSVAPAYSVISQEEAKALMDSEENIAIVDARDRSEYEQGHIPGALLLPYTEVESKAAELLPDKEQCILVYCRSGRRSKLAAETLVKLGYTDVREFGGITTWPYGTEK
ncbi:MAG: rhodanese-like domain-containing protein [Clostridia bacterium]|nr:rhodanese-like domain-containing protein [Clostridia bacterium]